MHVELEGWAPYAIAGDWFTVLTPPGLARLGKELEPVDSGQPMLLSVDGDDIWYTHSHDGLVRRGPDGTHTEVALPEGSAPYGVAARDGEVWFTAAGTNRIGHRATDGTITWFDLPIPGSRPAMITLDADGTPWAALNGAAAIAEVVDGTVEIIELTAGSAPVGIAAGGGGVWFADIAGGSVGRIAADGTVHRIALPDPACRPHAVAVAADGSCWATLWGSGRLAHVTIDGDITLHDLPGKEPHGLWVTSTEVRVAMESGTIAVINL
jgi:virginiamycin B lyase